ncbi:MAG: hypothetical protein ISS43_01495 [Candidatus Omnitrophica bacterium]|nr:hypothetical protein [Candidatus Omnitrophota bacterium]
MINIFTNKKALSTLEYTVLIVVIGAGLLVSFNYLKRGVQGRFKNNADVFSSRQYRIGETTIVGR